MRSIVHFDATVDVASRRVILALAVLAALIVLAPLLATPVPPLHDYPGHLARMDAIAVLTGQASHPTHYRLGSFLLPNEAMDLATLGLTAFLPPLLAGRVFLGIVLLMLLGGTMALHFTLHGRLSPWPLVAACFLYNWIFLFGFINYLFGVGVMLWSVAAWLAMARAGVAVRVVAGTALAVITLFCHLVAFGLFAVILGGLALTEAFTLWRETGRLEPGALLVPAIPIGIGLLLFVLVSPTAGAVTRPFVYEDWFGWKPLVAYRTLLWPIPWLNVATTGPLVALVAFAAWRGRFRMARSMWLPLALLGMTFVIMPNHLFGAQYADARLPIAVLLVAIAAFDLRLPPRAPLLAGAAFIIALLVVRSSVIAGEWHAMRPLLAEYEAAFDRLPAGATLYVASAEPFPKLAWETPAELARWHPPLKHIVSLASIGRDVFVAATWADRFQQPIEVLPAGAAAKHLQGDNPFLTPTAASLREVVGLILSTRAPATPARDFLLLLRPGSMTGDAPPGLAPVASGGSFTLFRVE